MREFASASVPPASVPIRLPAIVPPLPPEMRMASLLPVRLWPAMTLPAPAALPPMTVALALLPLTMPLSSLPSAAVPAALRPM